MKWPDIEKKIKEKFGKQILKWAEHNERRIYADIPLPLLKEFVQFLLGPLKGRFIIASGVDTPRGVIEILYHFDFYQLPQVFSLRVMVDKKNPKVESLAGVSKAIEWIEREIHELLGIEFTGHPDMRHLILPDDWPEGNYPLRRDQ
ncbi:NADH-quinone oxidoreductase subunit C [bacterium]|nr:NADH-quinone oxidoreductase subunit C [bacterium]